MTTPDIAIVGAGIAGLTTALALAEKGIPTTLYDQAAELSEAGAGIQLSPNATRVLIGLGLNEALADTLVLPDAIQLFDGHSGARHARIPLGHVIEQRCGAPYWVVHRADLQAALLAAAQKAPLVQLRLDHKLTTLAPEGGENVTLSFAAKGGDTVEVAAQATICADGVWSLARKALFAADTPRYSGFRAWRVLVPRAALTPPFSDNIVASWLGPDGHVVHYPVRGGTLVNFVVVSRDADMAEGWGLRDDSTRLVAKLRHWHPALRHALNSAPADDWRVWALVDGESLPRWQKGAAVLIGDAAHPMLPFLAQGGAAAIEDAAALAELLSQTPSQPALAFQRFEALRKPRTTRIQETARQNGRIFHMRGPLALARNMVLRHMPGPHLGARFDWLYRHDARRV